MGDPPSSVLECRGEGCGHGSQWSDGGVKILHGMNTQSLGVAVALDFLVLYFFPGCLKKLRACFCSRRNKRHAAGKGLCRSAHLVSPEENSRPS